MVCTAILRNLSSYVSMPNSFRWIQPIFKTEGLHFQFSNLTLDSYSTSLKPSSLLQSLSCGYLFCQSVFTNTTNQFFNLTAAKSSSLTTNLARYWIHRYVRENNCHVTNIHKQLFFFEQIRIFQSINDE